MNGLFRVGSWLLCFSLEVWRGLSLWGGVHFLEWGRERLAVRIEKGRVFFQGKSANDDPPPLLRPIGPNSPATLSYTTAEKHPLMLTWFGRPRALCRAARTAYSPQHPCPPSRPTTRSTFSAFAVTTRRQVVLAVSVRRDPRDTAPDRRAASPVCAALPAAERRNWSWHVAGDLGNCSGYWRDSVGRWSSSRRI